jgi:hypothetical protein
MKNNMLELLQDWYLIQCDGDWEHEFGIKIDTLDNPGWVVNIDLIGTECENKRFNEIDQQINENNWIQCNVKEGKFIGAGGPQNLTDIIRIFISWKDS